MAEDTTTDKLLGKLYYEGSGKERFGGIEHLYKKANEISDTKINKQQVKEWLLQQPIYTQHVENKKT